MNSQQFEEVVKKIDPRFMIVPNANRPGLSNILFEGKNYDLPAISTHLIKEDVDAGYRYEFPNGMSARHWTQNEITSRLEQFLSAFNKGDYDGI